MVKCCLKKSEFSMKIMKNISSYMLNSQFLRLIAEHVTFLKVRKFRKKNPQTEDKTKGNLGSKVFN